MGALSPDYVIAKRASRFMLAFAKAQSLEAALADAPTPASEVNSTLGLLWGVIVAHAKVENRGEQVALDAARITLTGLPGGNEWFRRLLEHRDHEQFQVWAELGELAVWHALRVSDSMPPLMDLARQYRADAWDGADPGQRAMPMPGSHLLAEDAGRAPTSGRAPPAPRAS